MKEPLLVSVPLSLLNDPFAWSITPLSMVNTAPLLVMPSAAIHVRSSKGYNVRIEFYLWLNVIHTLFYTGIGKRIFKNNNVIFLFTIFSVTPECVSR